MRRNSRSAHVRGRARRYPYFIAQLFVARPRVRGGVTYRATGVVAGPYRSRAKAERGGRRLAGEHHATFRPGFGSLHGCPVPEEYWAPLAKGDGR